ncbi:MAG: hypothetical protein K2N81_06605 [Acetatifactor sp.]|nr:hypothetical protein [Acetatifactor sp.]
MKKIKKLFEQIQTMGQKISGHSSDSDHSNASSSVSPTLSPPPVSAHTYALQILASGCAQGDSAAMLKLSNFLRPSATAAPGIGAAYYDKGANMWLLRAAIYGDRTAQEIVLDKIRQNPGFLNNTLIPYENFLPNKRSHWHSGLYSGRLLNMLGLLTFQPEESYLLAGISDQRTLLVYQEVDYDPPDEDGFGAETYYHMFFLDEFFQPLPEVPIVCRVSSRDITYSDNCKKQYDAMVKAMQEAADKRTKLPLWTEFIPEPKR